MDEWIWQYQELHPDQLRVVKRLKQTEEIYSPQVTVKDQRENWQLWYQNTTEYSKYSPSGEDKIYNNEISHEYEQ